MSITRDEWLAALKEVEPPEAIDDPTLIRFDELAGMLGMSEKKLRKALSALITAQKVQVASKIVHDRTGRPQRVTAYRLVK